MWDRILCGAPQAPALHMKAPAAWAGRAVKPRSRKAVREAASCRRPRRQGRGLQPGCAILPGWLLGLFRRPGGQSAVEGAAVVLRVPVVAVVVVAGAVVVVGAERVPPPP